MDGPLVVVAQAIGQSQFVWHCQVSCAKRSKLFMVTFRSWSATHDGGLINVAGKEIGQGSDVGVVAGNIEQIRSRDLARR